MESIDGVRRHDGNGDYVVKYKPQKVMFDDLCNDDAVSRPIGWVESSVEDVLAGDGSMRQMQVLSRPGDGLFPFGAIDAPVRMFAMADDLLVRFCDVGVRRGCRFCTL